MLLRRGDSHRIITQPAMELENKPNPEDSQHYRYASLNEEAHEIRLLKLLPSTFSSEVRLLLDRATFIKSCVPDFEALSYAWGSAENPVNISIQQSGWKTLPVTQNLAEALPYLRYQDRPRVLWIDAICP